MNFDLAVDFCSTVRLQPHPLHLYSCNPLTKPDFTFGENKTKKSSTKSVCLLGKLDGKLYVIKCFLDRGLNAEFIDWYVKLPEYVGGRAPAYCRMENNKLQDPFFQQVFIPLVRRVRREKNISLYIRGDGTKKTDKATRIEANLEPLNREGNLILNEAEKDNPNMKRLEEQFKRGAFQIVAYSPEEYFEVKAPIECFLSLL